MLEKWFSSAMNTQLKTNKVCIETFYTKFFQYSSIGSQKYEIKQIIFALSYKNSSIQDTSLNKLKYLTFKKK